MIEENYILFIIVTLLLFLVAAYEAVTLDFLCIVDAANIWFENFTVI